MMRKFAFLIFLFSVPCFSQLGAFNRYCEQGATQSITSGLKSSNYLDGVIPKCTVTVYLTGTTTKATISSDISGTVLTNPFTAKADGSWLFYAANGTAYDVTMSGGGGNPSCTTQPNCYATPKTITGLINGSGGGSGTVTSISAISPVEVNGGAGPVTGDATISCPGCGGTTTNAVTFDPPTGTIEFANFPLTLSDTTPGATIYYCTDGGTNSCNPTTLYSGPITITSAINYVRAYASAANAFSSGIASWNGAVLSALAQPYFSPGAGIYTTAQTVTITSEGTDGLPGGGAFYTLDGSTPTCSSTPYTAPITISATATLKAIACATGYTFTGTTTAVYTINPSATPTATPVFSPDPGTYTAPVSATITDSTPGSTIYWKVMYPHYGPIFCGDPGATVYSGSFVVPTNSFVLSAIACASGYSSSSIALAGIGFTVPAPTFSLPTPYFGPGTSVSLTGIAGGTTYYCVTTGAACFPNLVYSTPLTFSSSETIYAYTFFGTAASNVVSWQGTLFTNSTTATNLAGGDATNAFPYQTAPSTTAFSTSAAMLTKLGAQPLLTNPVTGPGSGATVGHMAVMGNASGTSITDGGAVPTLSSLGGAALTGALFTGPVTISSNLSVKNLASIGPRYDVTNSAFGAVGNGSTDDTAAIQAAFDACLHGLTTPFGGVVEFPGPHTYVITSTINAYDGCRIEGVIGSSTINSQLPRITYSGTAAGTVYSVTQVVIATNSTFISSPAYPVAGGQTNRTPTKIATITAPNSLTAGQWVDFEGFSGTEGNGGLNRCIGQVASATSTSFVALIPCSLGSGAANGTYVDTGTATTVNVGVAFDAAARYNESIKSVTLQATTAGTLDIGYLFSSRKDSGMIIDGAWVAGVNKYAYYFAQGGINTAFYGGWRSDTTGLAGIYWRASGNDDLEIGEGTSPNQPSPFNGGFIVLDGANCVGQIYLHVHDVRIEVNNALTAAPGIVTMYDCPSYSSYSQFFLSFDNVTMTTGAGGVSNTFNMIPPNDRALGKLHVSNSTFLGGAGTTPATRWTGLPALARFDLTGSAGDIVALNYSPPVRSSSLVGSSTVSLTQIFGDVHFADGLTYRDKVQAADFIYSDTAFAALSNGTTLYAGQILAPPAYWEGANGKRYAIDVIYQAGTTGIPNGGATTCSSAGATTVLTCSSATDLSNGQLLSMPNCGVRAISSIDATNPSAVIVGGNGNWGACTNDVLSYLSPVFGPEIQLPTKSAAAPTTLAWSQGDMEQNSGATANGIAGWVNVVAGTPGTWAAIPLGDASGKTSLAQIQASSVQGTDSKIMTSGTISGTNSPLCTDVNGGASTVGCAAQGTPTVGSNKIEDIEITGNTSVSGYIAGCATQTVAWVGNTTTSGPNMQKYTSAAVTGDCAGFRTQFTYHANGWPLITTGAFFPASTDYSSSRIWIGLFANTCSQATIIASDAPACAGGYVALRYSSTASDATWQCITFDGTTQTISPVTGLSPSATTFQPITVAINSGTSGYCKVLSTAVSITTTLPSSSSSGWLVGQYANTSNSPTTAVNIDWPYWYAYYQNPAVPY